ncbi:MAG: aminotransferase class III-fold pyridoxal phosphate-dependent enzyme, partial [Firmicutes bacterium]|nr:aminotransferase class III-fold pyridoxal phosphate-dependent enzyme [Bacillota bacterium]
VMPIAAMVARSKWWEKMEDNPFILGSSTFGGNPLACAASIAAIHTIVSENVPAIAQEKGEKFLDGLRQLQKRYSDVLYDVRGRGLLMGMEFHSHEQGYAVAKSLFAQHVLVGGTLNNARVIRIEPPYVISFEQIAYVLEALETALESARSVAAGLTR